MPSTYSPNLRIELIANGEQSGTWGSTTNSNLGTLIEDAISGYVSVSITSANQALTALNGAADQSRNMVINLTTITAAPFNVYIPPAEKVYIIRNASAYDATIYCSTVIGNTTAAGTGVTVPAGRETLIFSDATNVALGIDYVSSLNLASPLPVASGGTGAATLTGVVKGNGTSAFTAGTVSLTSEVSGALPVANGGTGSTTAANARTNLGLGTIATQDANNVSITGGSITGITDLAVADGGTGASSFTANNVLLGNGSSSFQTVAPGTSGNVLTSNGTTWVSGTAFVAGMIMMWSGSIASIPSGWALCNGSSGTPDLRDRFVVGAGNTYAVGATGGSANATLVSHTHTASSSVSDPGHFHPVPESVQLLNSGNGFATGVTSTPRTVNSATRTTGITVSTSVSTEGSSATNANLPPYYALAFIMKL